MPLEFTEYLYPKTKMGSQPQLSYGPKIATQSLAIGAGSILSVPFNERTQHIAISKVDADCRIEIGNASIVAAAGAGNGRFLKAGNEYAFDVEKGQFLAVINA